MATSAVKQKRPWSKLQSLFKLRGGYLRLPMSLTIGVVTLKFLSGMGRNGGTLTP